MKGSLLAICFSAGAMSSAGATQKFDAPLVEPAAQVIARPVPVTAGDITDRPYQVVGRVETFVQKAIWAKPASQDKVFRELWERARRLGADAVVNATYSQPQCEFFRSCGGRQATGDAIRFVTPVVAVSGGAAALS